MHSLPIYYFLLCFFYLFLLYCFLPKISLNIKARKRLLNLFAKDINIKKNSISDLLIVYDKLLLKALIFFRFYISKVLFFCEKEDNEEIGKIIDTIKKTITNCAFIKVIDEVDDWQQLLLMSACSHNIIANSSFSWWGAYLNTNPSKIVCYPEVWFGPKVTHETSDLFPESWTKISCV